MVAQLYWNMAVLWPLVAVLILAALFLSLWLYFPQTQFLSRRWRWLLPALRVLAITALALGLLQPTLLRGKTDQEQGAVLFLLDNSASMAVADTQMSPADRVALAYGLGLLPDNRRTTLAPEALQGLRNLDNDLDRFNRVTADMQYARIAGRKVKDREEELKVLGLQAVNRAAELHKLLGSFTLDESLKPRMAILLQRPGQQQRAAWVKSVGEILPALETFLESQQADLDARLYSQDPQIRQVCDRVAAMPRVRLVEQVLTDPQRGLLRQIPPEVPLLGFSFAQGIQPLPLRAGDMPVRRLLLEADGPETRIAESLSAAVERVKGRAVRAVVICSDGRNTAGVTAISQLPGDLPVYALGCGYQNAVKDLAISAMTLPSGAFAGETVHVKVRIKGINVPPGEYPVQFQVSANQQSQPVKLDAAGNVKWNFPSRQKIPASCRFRSCFRRWRGKPPRRTTS